MWLITQSAQAGGPPEAIHLRAETRNKAHEPRAKYQPKARAGKAYRKRIRRAHE
jgi:hypothetical protein